jgi:hypothetical protein
MATTTFTPHPASRWLKRIGWALLLLVCLAVAVFSARYLINPPQTVQKALGNAFGLPWLAVHVAGSVVALALGAFQFVPSGRLGKVRAHRWIGRSYVLCCLVGGVSGVILAMGSSAGPIATAGFGLLGLSWIGANIIGWQSAVQKRFGVHRRWMIRSWALTLAAVTLRIYLPLLMISDLPFEAGYRTISFLAWVPNLLIAEWWLRRRKA